MKTVGLEQLYSKKFDELDEVHNNLAQLRKQFDDYRNRSMITEKEIQRFKDENNKLKLIEEQLESTNMTVSLDLAQIKNEFETAKQRFEESVMAKKSYFHIMHRLKHDIICFQMKQNQLDSSLKQQMSRQQYTDFKQKQSIQSYAQTQKQLDEMMKNIEQEHRTREEQLSMFKRHIKQRQEAERKRDLRLEQQMNIAEHALYDKDINEKKWRKLLLVHKFLHCLLKTKMEKEMKKFAVVEKAFQKIKTATGISEASIIVSKFLNKEQAYGDLLGKIASSEKKIDYIKLKNETLKNNFQKLKDEVQVMEMTRTSKKGLEADMYKELLITDDKAKKAEVMAEKLYNWSIKILQRLEKVQNALGGARTNFYEIYPHDKGIEAFKQVHQSIMSKLRESQNEQIDKVLEDLNRSDYNMELAQEEFQKRNIRVRFKKARLTQQKSFHSQSHESFTKESNKSVSQGGGSSGGGSQFEDSEDDGSVDEIYEADYIGNIRSEIKHGSQQSKYNFIKKKDNMEKKTGRNQQTQDTNKIIIKQE